MTDRTSISGYPAILLFLCVFTFSLTIIGQAEAEEAGLASLQEAYDHVLSEYLGGSTENKRVYGLPDLMGGPVSVDTWKRTITLGIGSGWLFFIDDHPMANWEHGCRYVFVTTGGDYFTEKAVTPPREINSFVEFTPPPNQPDYHPPMPRDSSSGAPDETNPVFVTDHRWAVIISGGANQSNNHIRYWNDCAYFYQTLIANGFWDSHILVLISDGTNPAVDRSNGTNSPTDLDGDGDADTGYAATAANITAVFNYLAGALDEDDILYIFTTDHGGSSDSSPYDDPDSTLWLWNTTTITDAAFAAEVNKVTTKATVAIFEQCYSGGMIDNLKGPNRVLMSASRFWELSYAKNDSGTYNYDEFSYYATYAMANPGVYDPNGDGTTSMEEAYLHALANDSRQSELISDGDNVGEHPSYYSNPWDLGRKISLQGYDGPVLPPRYGGYRQTQVSESYPTGGVSQGWSGDDVCYSYSLPFSFPFFGQNYSTVYVSTNGLILFDGCDTGYTNSVDGLKDKKAIAPLWDDLSTSAVYIDAGTSAVTVRWVGITTTDARAVAFAARLYKNGNIRFLYGAGNEHTSRIAHRDKTIGISKGDGTNYHLALRNGQGELGNALPIEFSRLDPSSMGHGLLLMTQ